MKVAITTQGAGLNPMVNPQFGRTRWFVVYDTESNVSFAVDNQKNVDVPQGAGVQMGRSIAELGVRAVITGHVGPKAFATLQACGVSIYTSKETSVEEAINQFKTGQLVQMENANAPGHNASGRRSSGRHSSGNGLNRGLK